MYDRQWIFHSERGSVAAARCGDIFLPYFDDRLLFTEGGRGENVLHTVFYLWNPVHGLHVPVRTATDRSNPSGVDADRVCRSPVMRSGIYAANCRAEGNEPDRGIPDFKYGIRDLRDRWMADLTSEAFRQGAARLCAYVCGDHSGTAPGEKETVTEKNLQKSGGC